MAFHRISSSGQANVMLSYVQQSFANMSKTQEQMASGHRILKPSDDPLGANQALRLNTHLGNLDIYSRNIDNAISELTTSESALSQVQSTIQRAQELAVQAANDTYSPSQRQALAQEFTTLIDSVVQQANSTYAGKYIFAGFKTDTIPFTRSSTGVAYAGSDNTSSSDYERQLQISDTQKVGVNLNGKSIFGEVTVAAGPTYTGSGLLYDMQRMYDDMVNNDTVSLRSRLDSLNDDLDTVSSGRSIIGARQNYLDNTKNQLQDTITSEKTFLSSLVDTDVAKATTDLAQQQNSYQASLAILGRIMQMNQSTMQYLF